MDSNNKIKLKDIDIYFFSGTGNTLLVVRKMKEVFVKNNINVNLYRIEKSKPQEINTGHTIGLAFPVACQSTYPFVWDFIRNLPGAKGTEVFMVDTMLAYSGAIVGPVKSVLRKKGYSPIGAREILMPSNIVFKKPDEQRKLKKISRGLKKAEKYAGDIINGKSRWGRVPVFPDLFYLMTSTKSSWRFYGKITTFLVDREKCNKCGICVKLCPRGNIRMEEYPVYSNMCQVCVRCFSLCPEEAIDIKGGGMFKRYRAVESREILDSGNVEAK